MAAGSSGYFLCSPRSRCAGAQTAPECDVGLPAPHGFEAFSSLVVRSSSSLSVGAEIVMGGINNISRLGTAHAHLLKVGDEEAFGLASTQRGALLRPHRHEARPVGQRV